MRLQNGIVHHERLERQKRTEIFAATLYERPKRLCSAIRFWCEHTVRATVSYCFLALFHTMCTWFYRGLRPLIYSLIFSVWCFFPEASVNVNVSIVWYGTKWFFSEYFNNIAGFYYIFNPWTSKQFQCAPSESTTSLLSLTFFIYIYLNDLLFAGMCLDVCVCFSVWLGSFSPASIFSVFSFIILPVIDFYPFFFLPTRCVFYWPESPWLPLWDNKYKSTRTLATFLPHTPAPPFLSLSLQRIET